MNKFWTAVLWGSIGAGTVIALGAAAGAETRRIAFARNTVSGNTLSVEIIPGRQRTGNQQVVVVQLRQNAKPITGQNVTITINGQHHTVTTDNQGQAELPFVENSAGAYSVTASATVAGKTVTTQSQAVWKKHSS